MKRMMLVLIVGVVLFGASAGVSFFLQKQETKDGHGDGKDAKAAHAKAPKDTELKTPAIPTRSLAKPTAESVAQLAASLRVKEDSLAAKEQKLVARQSQLDLVFADIKAEQKTLDALRADIAAEMKALDEKLGLLERKAGDLEKTKVKLSDHHTEIKRTLVEVDAVEAKRVKQMADVYNAMDPAGAGETFQYMADTGKLDLAVKIMAQMQDRQVAKVLSEMSDAPTKVQMLERLKGLKKTSVGTP